MKSRLIKSKGSVLRNVIKIFSVVTIFLFINGKALAQNEVQYGFTYDLVTGCVTANAYPNFTSTNVTVSTATFTFLVPKQVRY